MGFPLKQKKVAALIETPFIWSPVQAATFSVMIYVTATRKESGKNSNTKLPLAGLVSIVTRL